MAGITSPRIKKHSRSRTGCFTCRKRRIKCDEHRPICGRCEKGSRECVYPPPPKRTKNSAKKQDKTERPMSSSDSESSLNFDLSDTELEDGPQQRVIVRFSSASSHDSPTSESSPDLTNIQFDQKMLIDSLGPPMDISEPTLFVSNPLLTFSISGASPSSFCEGLRIQTSSPSQSPSTLMIQIPRPPKPTRSHPNQFFLSYHQENITEYHYFMYFDYRKLCTRTLLAMAEASDALRHAVVAFSALIYSIKVDRAAREQAFLFYAIALQELRALLDKFPMTVDECHIAVATALQLSAFDRFFGDTAKSFRHLQGAAHIMQKCSDPVQHCSHSVGRSLLEWYCGVEDYCCYIAAYKALLPAEWRHENRRIRQKLAHEEYPNLPPSERKARLLDDLWPQLWALVPPLGNIIASIPVLKTLKGPERSELAVHLEAELRNFVNDFTGFIRSAHVQEVLQPATSSYVSSSHATCCPPFLYTPRFFQFRPAGILQIALQWIQTYIRAVLYPCLRAELELDRSMLGSEEEDPSLHSVELCRTFAGIEHSFDDNPGALYPCFGPMVVAALACPADLRHWVWCKLAHFESLGQLCFEPIKKNLAEVWDMPEIFTKGFSPLPGNTPQHEKGMFDGENVDIATDMDKVTLHEGAGSGDDSLESLTQWRGIIGLD